MQNETMEIIESLLKLDRYVVELSKNLSATNEETFFTIKNNMFILKEILKNIQGEK